MFLVTTAGAMLPSFGGRPRVAEEREVEADIGSAGTFVLRGTLGSYVIVDKIQPDLP